VSIDHPNEGDLAPPPPPSTEAIELFGARLGLAESYVDLLATDAVVRGLIGPRETARLWDRHLVNSAVVAELFPANARVVDVGTGAGLPGLALACLRPDLHIDLVDSLARRTVFLSEAVAALGFGARVRVITGRVEDKDVRAEVGQAQWVTARAVAPLDRLARWCLPLLAPDGRLVALKGARAEQEITEFGRAVRVAGGTEIEVIECGVGRLAEPTRVVRMRRTSSTGPLDRR
jgi:16S rRNA (guanine527-N7)-methyltransferase